MGFAARDSARQRREHVRAPSRVERARRAVALLLCRRSPIAAWRAPTTHQLDRVVARQAGDIDQPGERFDSRCASYREGQAVDLGVGHLRTERRERLLDPLDRATLPQGQCARSAGSASSESRSIVRCCASFSTIERVNPSTTRSSRVGDIVGCVVGQQGRGRPSRDAPRRAKPVGSGSTGRRWCGRSTPLRLPLRPWASCLGATSSRAAATSASRVRRFWSMRPFSSYGIDMPMMVPYFRHGTISPTNTRGGAR